MQRIATHNSGTGEVSKNLLRMIVVPFARCQRKSVIEQYQAGASYFDFRIRNSGDAWVFAHGLWESKVNPFVVMQTLDGLCAKDGREVYISFTYEGYLRGELERKEFCDMIDNNLAFCQHIRPVYIQIRKPSWETLHLWESIVMSHRFWEINAQTARFLLPIPYLWHVLKKKFGKPDDDVDEEDRWGRKVFAFVDFL